MAYSRDFGRIFRNMDYWIELKRLLFKFFRITKFRTRSDKSIRSSILSKLKKELASQFARCGLTDRSVANQILTLLMWQNFNAKRGTQQKNPKTVGMETLNTRFFTNGIYFVQKNKVPFEYCLHFTKPQSRIFLWCREHVCNWPKNQSFAQW